MLGSKPYQDSNNFCFDDYYLCCAFPSHSFSKPVRPQNCPYSAERHSPSGKPYRFWEPKARTDKENNWREGSCWCDHHYRVMLAVLSSRMDRWPFPSVRQKYGIPAEVIFITTCMFFVSSLCNLVIYSARKREFQLGVKNVMRRMGICRHCNEIADSVVIQE